MGGRTVLVTVRALAIATGALLVIGPLGPPAGRAASDFRLVSEQRVAAAEPLGKPRSSGDVLGTMTLVAGPLPARAGLEVGDLASAEVVRKHGWTGEGPRLPDGCVQQAGKTCRGS